MANIVASGEATPVPKCDTLIASIIDGSGSMEDKKHQTIESYNLFLRDQKGIKGEAKIHLAIFNEQDCRMQYAEEVPWERIRTMRYLGPGFLEPIGGTPLYDAILQVISITDSKWTVEGKSQRVVIAVLTDGQDTASDHKPKEVITTIKEYVKLGWQFIFIAPDEWSAKEATKLGFQHVITYDVDKPKTISDVMASVSHAIGDYREGKPLELEHKR